MEAYDVLANNVAVCRPSCGVFLAGYLEGIIRFGEVVDEGVYPYIDSLSVIIRHRNTPAQPFPWS